MPRINTLLVTGGAGYIGSHAVYSLLKQGYRVVVFDNLSTGYEENIAPEAIFVEGNISDRAKVGHIIREYDIVAVLHFAGSIIVPESIHSPLHYYENNVSNSISLISTCIKENVRSFVFSSTAAVYENQPNCSVTEKDALSPKSPYGKSKLMIENVLMDCAKAYDFSYGILRYFNVAGADFKLRAGPRSKQTTHLIRNAVQTGLGYQSEFKVYGTDYDTNDGTCVRDFIHVSDLADAHVHVLKRLMNERQNVLVNCGYGNGYSVLEVLEQVQKALFVSIKIKNAPRRDGDIPKVVANSDKLRDQLGWVAQNESLVKIIDSSIAWEKHLRNSKSL